MPRTYKPDPTKRRYKKYEPNIISAALEDLKQPHASLMEIASKYNIHKSVLYRHSQKIMKRQGGQTALSEEAELHLIENINKCAEWGYPMDTMDLRFLVKMYLDKLGVTNRRFKNNFPGVDFVQSFLNRHKDKISQRICENIKRARAAVSPDVIRNYFNELEKSLQGVELSNIINYDETNLSDDPGRKKVLMKRGCKYPERVVNHSKSSVSIMMAGTADGAMLVPPYVVYKAQNVYDTWVLHGPKGTRYNYSSSGWFEGTIFEDWVKEMVIPYFKDKPGRKILIGDNLSSHLSVSLITLCREKDIEFIFLPPNSTHLTQPLDVAFFRPMKRAWREILLKWKKTDGQNQASVPKGCFPKLLKLLIEHLKPNAQKNLQAGFKKTGIHPLNIEEIMSRLPQEHNGDDVKSAVDDSVLQLLKEMRYGTMNVREPRKKRKLDVVAGRSVSAEDAETNDETVAAKKSKPRENKVQVKGKGKKTKVFTIQNQKNLNTESTPNNQLVILEAEKIEAMDGIKLDELHVKKRKLEVVAGTSGTAEDAGNNLETNNETAAAKKSKLSENKVKGKGKGKRTKVLTIQNEKNLTTESTQKNNELTKNNEQTEDETNKNNEAVTEAEKIEAMDGLKFNELDINSMPFIYVESECEVISECKNNAKEEEQSYNIVNEANNTVNITQHENNLTEMKTIIETKNDIDIQKNKKVNKITDNENKNKKIKENAKENREKGTKNEKYPAESGSSLKTDININKMNKVKIISNKTGGLAQYVVLKDCKPITIKDVMKVPNKSTAKKTEIKNYYNNTKEIFKVLTDSD